MDKLWILTEEKPKISVIEEILKLYAENFKDKATFSKDITIEPNIKAGIFNFYYTLKGVKLDNCSEIILITVSGNSSFIDFLVFKQENKPNGSKEDNLLMAVEETKTSGKESRNTGVYQRGSKFVFFEHYYKNVKKYMLYNEECENDDSQKPADTIIFGTNMFLSMGIDIVGKSIDPWFNKFSSIDDLIAFKRSMRAAPNGNVPITINQYDDRIEISGRLDKPSGAGNIAHDPNIGALSLISKTIRDLGWTKDIVITKHGVKQEYINNTRAGNKFLYICKILNLKLANIVLPENIKLPDKYWHYETRSEKMASILLHILAENAGLKSIYQNHAGCERGYFITRDNRLIALPKVDSNGVKLYIPDLVLYSKKYNEIILLEGKKLETLEDGLREINNYNSIENEYIKPEYSGCKISRYLTIFGGNLDVLPHEKVLFYLNSAGKIIIPNTFPAAAAEVFSAPNISISHN